MKAENVALMAPGLCSLGKTSWLPTSWQKEENGAEETLLYLEEINVHTVGRAMTGKKKGFPQGSGEAIYLCVLRLHVPRRHLLKHLPG